MPTTAARKITFTPDEYFDWEERQEEHHEYHHGEVYPMPGGTYEHFLVIANWVVALRNALADADASVLPDGMRLQINEDRYVYPDVSVVLGEPAFRDESRRVLLNPTVVVEVLSESTEVYDRGEKLASAGLRLAFYREVPSLREIVWVDPDRRWAEVAVKTDDAWTLPAPVTGGAVALPSLGVEVALDDLYRGVDL